MPTISPSLSGSDRDADAFLDENEAELEQRGHALDLIKNLREHVRRRCEEDFGFFARTFWHILEPGVPYVHGRHVEAIVDHLNACLPRWIPEAFGVPGHWVVGQIRELLIEMPFRHGKSSILTLWTAYVWTIRPEFRWLTTSYALSLATRDTMRMRAIVTSFEYRAMWGHKFSLLRDQNKKDRFYNSRMGYRMTASRDAGATGEGGDCIMCDDAHNIRDADSKVSRDATITWWFETMSPRKNHPELSFSVVCGQRAHQFDLANACRERGYQVLSLPARYDPALTKPSRIGWRDWRHTDRELLWPERFNEKAMAEIEHQIGEYAVACQLQQNPTPRGGAFIKREWFKRIDGADMKYVEGSIVWVRAWDLALSKTGNGVASIEMGQDAHRNTYMRRGLFWHEDWTVTAARVKTLGGVERNQVWLEAIGTTASAAKEAGDSLLGSCMVTLQETKTNKVSEAIPWISAAQAGQMIFVEETEDDFPLLKWNSGPWIEHFLQRFCGWIPDPTLDQADDEVDCVSLGFTATRGKVPFTSRGDDLPERRDGYGDAGFNTDGRY